MCHPTQIKMAELVAAVCGCAWCGPRVVLGVGLGSPCKYNVRDSHGVSRCWVPLNLGLVRDLPSIPWIYFPAPRRSWEEWC